MVFKLGLPIWQPYVFIKLILNLTFYFTLDLYKCLNDKDKLDNIIKFVFLRAYTARTTPASCQILANTSLNLKNKVLKKSGVFKI